MLCPEVVGGMIFDMARRLHDDYIDDVPEGMMGVSDEADEAFWDEFFFLESRTDIGGDDLYTVTIENEFTGDRKTMKHVRLISRGKRKSLRD